MIPLPSYDEYKEHFKYPAQRYKEAKSSPVLTSQRSVSVLGIGWLSFFLALSVGLKLTVVGKSDGKSLKIKFEVDCPEVLQLV